MKKELRELINSIPGLSEEEKGEIVDSIVVKTFRKGDYLLKEGEICNHCYYVLKGCVRQFTVADGEETTVGFYTEGDVATSHLSYSKQTPATDNLVCMEDCTLTVGTPEGEEKAYAQFPALQAFANIKTSEITGDLQNELFNFIASSPEERYVHLMRTNPDLFNRVPLYHIASYIGVTPESLSRIRKRLAKQITP